jgi:RHS repeat-associated protein
LTSGGSGYTSTPTVSFSGGGGSGAAATANLVPTAVYSLVLTNRGSGYSSNPTVTISGGGGSGATASAAIAYNIQTLSWDVENRLAAVNCNGITTSYVYDGDGKRVKTTVGSTVTTYINQYYEKTGTVVTTNYYLGSKLIVVKQGENLSYIMQDHLGSTSATTNASGLLTSAIKYFPFGVCRNSSGTLPTDKLFTGQRLDDNTGLYYYGARYYDPVIGRFISADTIVPNPANPQTLNRYSYCLNNPLKYIDPSGHHATIINSDGKSITLTDDEVDKLDPSRPYADQLDWSYSDYLERGGCCGYSHWHSGQEFVRGLVDTIEEIISDCGGGGYTPDELAAIQEEERYMLTHPDEVIKAYLSLTDSSYGWGVITAGILPFFIRGGGKGGAKLLNPSITITAKRWKHIIGGHTGVYNGEKSVFDASVDIRQLIQDATQMPMTRQANGNYIRTVDAGRNIGIDRATGLPTSIYNVVTRPDGRIWTAFPGTP